MCRLPAIQTVWPSVPLVHANAPVVLDFLPPYTPQIAARINTLQKILWTQNYTELGWYLRAQHHSAVLHHMLLLVPPRRRSTFSCPQGMPSFIHVGRVAAVALDKLILVLEMSFGGRGIQIRVNALQPGPLALEIMTPELLGPLKTKLLPGRWYLQGGTG